MRVLFAIACGVAGCSGSSPTTVTREPVCVPGDDAALFAALTAQRWGACGASVGLCVELSAAGDYRTTQGAGDYVITGEGRWNFLARDASSGLVCLDDGSVIDFALGGDGLVWGLSGPLAPGEGLAPSGARDALPELLPAEELFSLTAHAWAKTNDFDLYGYPTAFALHRDGTFEAEFRDGACVTTGTFSLVETNVGIEINPRARPNTCDARTNTTANLAASNDHPKLTGGVLRLYGASYRDAAASRGEHSLVFSAYGDDAGLLVGARWPGPLSAGAPTPWKFSLDNPTLRMQTVTSIQLALTPVEPTTGGFSAAGPAVSVLDRAVNELVAPGGRIDASAELTLSGSGLVMLEISVSSYDEIQRYRNQRHFMFSL